MQSHGLTFSLTDVNLDNFNLNFVPIITNSKPEKEIEKIIEKENTLFSNAKETTVLESDSKDISIKQLNPTPDSFNPYEPVLSYWFYCVIKNGLAEWKPFSIKDSSRMEHRYLQTQNYEYYNNYSSLATDDCVPTEGGRYDVYIKKRQKVSIYWEEPPMEIRRASWFYRPEDESFYLPYSESECDLLEDQYKRCLAQNLWHQSFQLTSDFDNTDSVDICIDSKFVFHSPNTMAEYRRYPSTSENITKGRVVYRSIESFRHHLSPGENDEIDHVVFVIPGIGSVCDMSGRGIIECVSSMRSLSATLMQSHFQSYRQGSGRVEFLPVSWHNQFHKIGSPNSQTSGIDKDLDRISLKSVPKLRQFTSNALIDVLCYSSTAYRQSILSIVAAEMNRLRHLFVSRNPQYEAEISIAGHSLGSMIAFDLVALQGNQIIDPGNNNTDISAPTLEFEIGHLFALGSPISLLLTARGLSTLGPDFRLDQCKGGFFNIFHPFDPVAYRIEPMLDSHWQNRPIVLPHHKGRKRLHLELKDNLVRVSNDIKTKLVHTLKNTWNSLQEFATAHKTNLNDEFGDEEMVHVLNKIDVANTSGERDDYDIISNSISHGSHDHEKFIGQLNGGRRVDYVLQEAPLESFNDYLFALGSHACYWDSEDTILMMLKEIYQTRNIFPSGAQSVPITPQLNSSISNVSKSSQPPPLLPLLSLRPQVKTNILLPPAFPSGQKSMFVPSLSPEHLGDNEFSHDVIENKKPVRDNANNTGSENFPNLHDNNWKESEDLNFDFSHQRHLTSSEISTSFIKEPTTFEEINIHEGLQWNVSSQPFKPGNVSQCEGEVQIKESSNVCSPEIGFPNLTANDHQLINESQLSQTDKLRHSFANVGLHSQYVNTNERVVQKMELSNTFPFNFPNLGSKEFFQPNYSLETLENQETLLDSSDDISSRKHSTLCSFPDFDMMTQRSVQGDNGYYVPQIDITYQQKTSYTPYSDETRNEIVTEAFDTINLIDAVDKETASSNLQYPPPPLMPFSPESSCVPFQGDAPKWPSHQTKQQEEFNCSPLFISNKPIKMFQPSIPSDRNGQLTQYAESSLMNLSYQMTTPPNNWCQSEIHSSETEPCGKVNAKSCHIDAPPPMNFLQSDFIDFSKNLCSGNSRDLGKPFLESKSINLNYSAPILGNQLKNAFQPTVILDDSFSGLNDNFPDNSFLINTQLQNKQSPIVTVPFMYTETAISNVTAVPQVNNYSFINSMSRHSSPSPLASMFSETLSSDFDSLSNKEQQESQYMDSSYILKETSPALVSQTSNDSKRKSVVTKELQSDSCRTPSPRIFSPNLRHSLKANPLVSSVFNSRPLVPQSGKLFKKK